ncbi:MAG TPA: hypothetical protein VIL52_04675 [Bacteroidota bacterium]
MKTLLLFLGALVFAPVLNAQQQAPCKQSPEFRQFDFWVGEWEVRNPKGEKVGDSSIQLIIDDCVISENYTGVRGYTGKSFNIYNAPLKKWQQFWVDSQGGVLEFSGAYSDGKLEYTAVSIDTLGKPLHHRMAFFDMPDKTVRQLWEQSTDGGKQWATVFDGTYVKKK